MDPRERRRHPRIEVTFRVALAFSGGRTEGTGELMNLSESGCAVRADRRVPDKAFLQITIQIPGRTAPLAVKNAAVRWVRGFDIGLEFVSLAPDEQAQIRDLVRRLQAGAQAPAAPVGKGQP